MRAFVALLGCWFLLLTAETGSAAPPAPPVFRPGISEGPAELLPDLDIVAPGALLVKGFGKAERRFLLTFRSSAENVGAGPLTLRASRAATNQPEMTAEQLIQRSDGTITLVPDVGSLRFIVSNHQHWHLLGFMRYELRRAANDRLVRPDEKTGFCLGDRYRIPEFESPAVPEQPVFLFSSCGLDQPEQLTLEEGISVGYGDNYERWRDGQYIDLTGIQAGLYTLVHRVNPERMMRESSYANNASSLLIRLSWPHGTAKKPRIVILRSCSQSPQCAAPRLPERRGAD